MDEDFPEFIPVSATPPLPQHPLTEQDTEVNAIPSTQPLPSYQKDTANAFITPPDFKAPPTPPTGNIPLQRQQDSEAPVHSDDNSTQKNESVPD